MARALSNHTRGLPVMLAAEAVDHHPFYNVGKKAVGVVLRARELGVDKAVNYGRVK